MKTKSPFTRSIGVLLALLVFAALPATLLANCGTADDPYCELVYGPGNSLYLKLVCPNPTGATIFFTYTLDTPNTTDPTHSGSTPGSGTSACASGTLIPIPYGHTIYIRAICWKSCWSDSGVVACEQHNPND